MNNNYRFISADKLSSTIIDDIAKLVFDTGYYELCANNNQLKLSSIEFVKQLCVLPYINYINVLIDNKDNAYGFHLLLTQKEIATIPKLDPNLLCDTNMQDIISIFNDTEHIKQTRLREHDLLGQFMAIYPNFRGAGLVSLFGKSILSTAKKKDCNRVFISTWESKIHAVEVFKHYGAQIIGVHDYSNYIFKDKIINFVFDIDVLEYILNNKT